MIGSCSNEEYIKRFDPQGFKITVISCVVAGIVVIGYWTYYQQKHDALYLAAAQGNVVTVAALLRNGSNPNELYRGLESPLHVAVEAQSLPCVELLLKNGARPNDGSFLRAATKYDDDAASAFVNDKSEDNYHAENDLAIIKALVTAGADTRVFLPGDERVKRLHKLSWFAGKSLIEKP